MLGTSAGQRMRWRSKRCESDHFTTESPPSSGSTVKLISNHGPSHVERVFVPPEQFLRPVDRCLSLDLSCRSGFGRALGVQWGVQRGVQWGAAVGLVPVPFVL